MAPPIRITGSNGKDTALPQVAASLIAPGQVELIAKCVLFNLAAAIAGSFGLELTPKKQAEEGSEK